MNFRKTITYGLPIALATVISASSANALFFDNAKQLQAQTITGDTFDAHLAREYQALTAFEWDKMYDWTDAENHATKGLLAAKGEAPMPYEPAEWNIESEAELNQLQQARSELMTRLDNGARTGAPALAAKAQANFDCWVEQQEEGHQPAHIAACKDKFFESMSSLDAALAPPKVAEAEPKLVTTVASQEIAREVVFFDFDKASISPQEVAKIDQFAAKMRDIKGAELVIVGHADTSGPSDYNQKLSDMRARTVADKLISEGMNVRELDDMKVEAEGETKPAVITGDGVREERNRRVEIVAVGDIEVTQQVTTLDKK